MKKVLLVVCIAFLCAVAFYYIWWLIEADRPGTAHNVQVNIGLPDWMTTWSDVEASRELATYELAQRFFGGGSVRISLIRLTYTA